MDERRQAARRTPITIAVHDGREFVANPLPWMQAHDLADEIVRQNAEGVNDAVRLFVQDDIPQLELKVGRKITDWAAVLLKAYPEVDIKEWGTISSDEAASVVLAALEVNHLEHLNHLVDPNLNALTPPGGTSSSALGMMLGQRTESIPDFDLPGSPEPTPSTSPVEK